MRQGSGDGRRPRGPWRERERARAGRRWSQAGTQAAATAAAASNRPPSHGQEVESAPAGGRQRRRPRLAASREEGRRRRKGDRVGVSGGMSLRVFRRK